MTDSATTSTAPASLPPLVEDALGPPLFGLDQQARESRLDPVLRTLTEHHLDHSPEYRGIVDAMFPDWRAHPGTAGLPWIPVGIFKRRTLKSVPDNEVFKTITSSGTTGQTPSMVHVDRTTAKRQTKALTSIMGHLLGPGRRPMLIIDTDSILSDRTSRTARAAGVVGLMPLGRDHTFALDSEMQPQLERVTTFLQKHAGKPLLVFGFTFMVWKYLVQTFEGTDLDLSCAAVIHSGGWKQMESEKVGNEEFKSILQERFGIEKVVNFYGMAEQVGSVFTEGDDGLLHASAFADVIVRDPDTWDEVGPGTTGVLQVLSAVPTSYPGHSILTEDLGVVEHVDASDDRLGGKAFRVVGRLPKSELRGCSDTFAAGRRG